MARGSWASAATPGRRDPEERARLVVGADGRRSLVARAVAAPAYRARPALTCAYYTYWSDIALEEEIEGYFLPRRVILVFPTNDDQVCVFLQWPHAVFRCVRADVEAGAGGGGAGAQPGRAAAGRPTGCTRGRHGRPAQFLPHPIRPGLGPGRGRRLSPRPGNRHGVATRSATLSSCPRAVDACGGRQPLAAALAGDGRRRDEAATAMYELTCQRAHSSRPRRR